MSETEDDRRLRIIRERAEGRASSGLVGGVREWFEINFLLELLDRSVCKKCKKELDH